jgi:cyclopropane fatty-acyl-phospholipid synthase-like methyltransferase
MNDLFSLYTNDKSHMEDYIAYQARYRKTPRESDKVILDLLSTVNGETLLDIGCSTGNLLYHIKNRYGFTLTGGDMSTMEIESCKNDPALSGITFRTLDIRYLPEKAFDVIISNAILYGFDDDDFSAAIKSICGALRSGGSLIAFDFFHPFRQEVSIIEKSNHHQGAGGLHPMHFRSYANVEKLLASTGFTHTSFKPFKIQIDLPFQGYDSITTYTSGGFQFRGCLSQPWCHLISRAY